MVNHKSVMKGVMKSKFKKSSTSKSKPKRKVKATSLYIRSYNQFTPSKLVKHSKYVSRTECYVALYLSFRYSVIQQFKIDGVKHLFDIYIPRLNLIIEYDGDKYHKNKKRDAEVDKLAKDHGFKMLRIKEKDYMQNDRLKWVKRCMLTYDPGIAYWSTSSYQKNLLKEFWKK